MKPLNICATCKDPDKECLTKLPGKEWICDDCSADLEYYDRHCEEYEDRKRQRLAVQNER